MRRIRRPLLALIALVVAVAIGYGVKAVGSDGGSGPSSPSSPSVATSMGSSAGGTALSSLPSQAGATIDLIRRGGPYPYPRNDGVVFQNNERLLPKERDGYYHEYTVPTPGSPDRGARRIITGSRGEYYYTGDHYEHFVRVDVNR